MRIVRRLFVVPVADNDHGKTSILRALTSQAEGRAYKSPLPRKGTRTVTSPWGRHIHALIYGRSYQETEKRQHMSVVDALNKEDPLWRCRELIIMPSHVGDILDKRHSVDDIEQMIDAAHSAGFDAVCASVLFNKNKTGEEFDFRGMETYDKIWRKNWDERWTIPNTWFENSHEEHLKPYVEGQLDALGRDLWVKICETLTR